MKGDVTKAKEHLMAKKDNVVAYTKTPKNVREELWKLYKERIDSSFVNCGYNAAKNLKVSVHQYVVRFWY